MESLGTVTEDAQSSAAAAAAIDMQSTPTKGLINAPQLSALTPSAAAADDDTDPQATPTKGLINAPQPSTLTLSTESLMTSPPLLLRLNPLGASPGHSHAASHLHSPSCRRIQAGSKEAREQAVNPESASKQAREQVNLWLLLIVKALSLARTSRQAREQAVGSGTRIKAGKGAGKPVAAAHRERAEPPAAAQGGSMGGSGGAEPKAEDQGKLVPSHDSTSEAADKARAAPGFSYSGASDKAKSSPRFSNPGASEKSKSFPSCEHHWVGGRATSAPRFSNPGASEKAKASPRCSTTGASDKAKSSPRESNSGAGRTSNTGSNSPGDANVTLLSPRCTSKYNSGSATGEAEPAATAASGVARRVSGTGSVGSSTGDSGQPRPSLNPKPSSATPPLRTPRCHCSYPPALPCVLQLSVSASGAPLAVPTLSKPSPSPRQSASGAPLTVPNLSKPSPSPRQSASGAPLAVPTLSKPSPSPRQSASGAPLAVPTLSKPSLPPPSEVPPKATFSSTATITLNTEGPSSRWSYPPPRKLRLLCFLELPLPRNQGPLTFCTSECRCCVHASLGTKGSLPHCTSECRCCVHASLGTKGPSLTARQSAGAASTPPLEQKAPSLTARQSAGALATPPFQPKAPSLTPRRSAGTNATATTPHNLQLDKPHLLPRGAKQPAAAKKLSEAAVSRANPPEDAVNATPSATPANASATPFNSVPTPSDTPSATQSNRLSYTLELGSYAVSHALSYTLQCCCPNLATPLATPPNTADPASHCEANAPGEAVPPMQVSARAETDLACDGSWRSATASTGRAFLSASHATRQKDVPASAKSSHECTTSAGGGAGSSSGERSAMDKVAEHNPSFRVRQTASSAARQAAVAATASNEPASAGKKPAPVERVGSFTVRPTAASAARVAASLEVHQPYEERHSCGNNSTSWLRKDNICGLRNRTITWLRNHSTGWLRKPLLQLAQAASPWPPSPSETSAAARARRSFSATNAHFTTGTTSSAGRHALTRRSSGGGGSKSEQPMGHSPGALGASISRQAPIETAPEMDFQTKCNLSKNNVQPTSAKPVGVSTPQPTDLANNDEQPTSVNPWGSAHLSPPTWPTNDEQANLR
eukprot:gene12191-15314_t